MASRKAGLASGVEVAKITVRVQPDTKEFRRELKADLEEIERSVKAKIEVEPDMGDFREEVKAKTEGMRAKVKVDADVDKGFFSGLAKKLENIQGPGFGSGINPMGYAVIAAGVLSIAAPLVGIISAALLALPGLLSVVLAPIAAITVGLDGIKNAAKVLEAPFKQLQGVMSKVNEAAFTPVFQKLRDIFPALEASMPAVSQGLAQVAQSIVNAVTSGPGLELIRSTFTNIGAALGRVNLGGFTDGMLKLVNAFSGGPLDGLTNWLTKTSDSFGNWITKITTADANGVSPFTQAMDGLGGSLKIVLDTVVDLGKKGFEFISKPENMENFKNDLNLIKDTLNQIMTISEKVSAFKWPEWLGGKDGKPKDNGLGGFPGIQPEPIEALKNSKGPGWLDRMEIAINKLGDPNFWKGTGPGAGNITEDPDFGPLKEFFKGSTEDPDFGPLKKMFELPDFGPIKEKWTELKGFFTSNPLFNAPATGGGDGGTGMFQLPDFEPLKAKWAEVKSFFTSNPLELPDFSKIMEAPDFGPLKSAVSGAWEEVKNTVSSAVSTVVSTVQNMVSQVVSAVSSIDLVSAGRNAVQGFINGIGSMIGAAVAKAKELASSVASAVTGFLGIHSPSVLFTGFGQNTAEGFGIGLQDGFEPVLNQAKDLAAQVSASFAAGNVDPTTALAGYSQDDIKRLEKTLTLETKRLEIQAKALDYQAKLQKNDGLKEQAKALRDQKDQLSLQKDMLDTAKEFNDTGDDSKGDVLTKAVGNLMSSPVNFAKATGKQFLSDIGISGDGVIGKALTEGVKYIFQIGSVDEALSIKDRTESKEKLAITGRGGV